MTEQARAGTWEEVRTLVVTSSYPAFDGDPAGHFVRSEVQERLGRGEDVRVLVPRSGENGGATSASSTLSEIAAMLPHGDAFGWPGAAARLRANPFRALGVARFVAAVGRELRARNPERVIAHWVLPCGTAALGGKWELEVVSHGADVRLLCALPAVLRNDLARRFVDRATTWRFVSQGLQADLARALPTTLAAALGRKSVIAPSPLRMEIPADLPPKRDDEKRLVWVGRLVPSKDLDRALHYVSRSQRGAHLVVVGDGPSRRAHERTASKLGVHASFVGRVPRPEALAWIASADTLLMSSRAEGLSTVVREAEVLGTPVLWV